MMKDLAWIALAGAVGTVSRYAVAGWAQKLGGAKFPWGTLAVNMIGCFLFGLIFALAEERFVLSSRVRIIFLTGFMGAFTTFSTFGFETAGMVRDGQWISALTNLAVQNVGGIICVLLGFALARIL
ncbi:fluoride efflux transporter CrcB [bacterium]|nr:fluoride efflux transporter CrcB [bacterium]